MQNKGFSVVWLALIIIILGIGGIIALAISNKDTIPEVSIPEKPLNVFSTDWIKGTSSAPVVLIEYGDFQCPGCASYHRIMPEILSKYGDDVLFVYRHFPLPIHGLAKPSAYSAEAAGLQGKFWEMYDILYTRQNEWSKSTTPETMFENYAKELGLDIEKFNQDRQSDTVKARVYLDQKVAQLYNLPGTPSFFVNGELIKNLTPENITSSIEQVLNAKKAN